MKKFILGLVVCFVLFGSIKAQAAICVITGIVQIILINPSTLAVQIGVIYTGADVPSGVSNGITNCEVPSGSTINQIQAAITTCVIDDRPFGSSLVKSNVFMPSYQKGQ